jgi:Protein prenyltransferase alpha subunit repeat
MRQLAQKLKQKKAHMAPTVDQLYAQFIDVTPIPSKVLPYEIAAIACPSSCTKRNFKISSQHYSLYLDAKLMELFRAVCATNELSLRALDLTSLIIEMNPSFYSAWLFRVQTLDHLALSSQNLVAFWETEMLWLNALTEVNLKSYQIWQHRQNIISRLPTVSSEELLLLDEFLLLDPKNYHLWSYR